LLRTQGNGQNSAHLKQHRAIFPLSWSTRQGCASLLLGVALLAFTGCQSPWAKDRRAGGTAWYQGGESAALYLQGFALARRQLDIVLTNPAPAKPLAIITDIDETVLDNSPYQAWLIEQRKTYSPATWKQWTVLARAKALPGAREFLDYADGKKVRIFYVTNRDQDEADATLKNLRAEGFPQAEAAHLFCKRNGLKSKDDRRDEITRTHTVCLLLGDNLSDFSSAFDLTVLEERGAAVTHHAARFGSNWIVFPNPMYGDWEKARPAGATNAIFSVPTK
jgi:5'-nucleotidase (lipoprotein e(P4) family)